ncbi:MAG: nuclear transport factor 2 family protein [Archangiaceae bacterium]|nr:nuclear transport factor 2 family protein [Archangiaceae bacterium]
MTVDLDALFGRLTTLLYDTEVPMETLEAEVMPYIADDVKFTDPWQSESGREQYRAGLAGFHRMFRFHLDTYQVGVRLDPDGKTGRAIVDSVMHLKQLAPLLTYPLRTILVYDFRVEGGRPLIYAHEEMWSFGDMLAAVPVVGPLYARGFRKLFARGFLLASRLATRGGSQL